MNSKDSGFINNIDSDFIVDAQESVFNELFREYERVVFRSIIASFGLDMFIKDQYGGDVDTIHNVRLVDQGTNMRYKNSQNENNYNNRGTYSHKDVEVAGTNFQRIKKEARSAYFENNNNTVQDEYENKPLGFLGKSKNRPTDKSAQLDHVLSASSIHKDRGRVLAGLSTVDLADAEINLRWTNEHLNKSMLADEIPDYISKHPELPDDVKRRMMDAYNQSKDAYEKRLVDAYYFDFDNPNCRQFYKDVAKSAQKLGLQMGLRQAIGFIMMEIWFSVRDEMMQSDGFSSALKSSAEGIRKGVEKVNENYKELFLIFGEGIISGIIASITTTLCNTFITTSTNAIKILREIWSSIVAAIGVLIFNEKDQYFCDRMKTASKIIATGASIIVGTVVQENVELGLANLAIPSEIKKCISIFSGSLATGIMSVSLLFYIDNGPFDRLLNGVFGMELEDLKNQAKAFREYCAILQGVDVERMNHDVECIYALSDNIGDNTSQTDIDKLIKKTMSELGLRSVLGEVSLNDLMQDDNWVLTF